MPHGLWGGCLRSLWPQGEPFAFPCMRAPSLGNLSTQGTGADAILSGGYYFIVNPTAGGGRTERLWPSLRDRLHERGVEFSWKLTSAPRSATLLARQAPPESVPVVVGGDGTLHEAVAGLSPRSSLGVIPTGRSNDFARSVGISTSPAIALEQLFEATTRPIDVPYVNGIPYLSTLGIGFGVHMAQSTQAFAKRISILDLFAVFKALPRFSIPELTVELDGRIDRGKVFLLAIGNGRYFGGGLNMCPGAHCDDGLLDVCIAGDLRRAEAVLALTRFFRGTHVRQRKFHYTKAHSIRVDGPSDVPVFADGDPVGRLPAAITIKQRALDVHVPDSAWRTSKVTSIWGRRVSAREEELSP